MSSLRLALKQSLGTGGGGGPAGRARTAPAVVVRGGGRPVELVPVRPVGQGAPAAREGEGGGHRGG
ncbi:hypothetical protein THAOC_11902, partial [Thalassiosira oceanica]